MCVVLLFLCFFFFKQKTAYEMRISDWSSDVCSSDLETRDARQQPPGRGAEPQPAPEGEASRDLCHGGANVGQGCLHPRAPSAATGSAARPRRPGRRRHLETLEAEGRRHGAAAERPGDRKSVW